MCFVASDFCEFFSPDLAFWFFWGFAWCFLVALLLHGPAKLISPRQVWWSHRWHGKYDVHSFANWILCQHDDGGVSPTKTPQFGFPWKARWNKKINGWLAVFKWTKTTFRQRFLKRLSKSLECWPRWRNTQHCKQMEWWPRCHRCDATSFASEELSTTPSMGRSPLGSHGVWMFEDHFGIRWAILLWSSSCFLETIGLLSFESENPASHDEYLISIERQISQYLSPAYHFFITFFC